MTETLAPHQQKLAELLGKRPDPGPGQMTAGWLAELKRDPARAVEGMQRTLAQQDTDSVLARLAMSMSEDPRMAEPDDPSAGAFCDYCGSTEDLDPDEDLGPNSTVPCSCHGMLTHPCRDTEACIRRREERYPPDMARVPGFIFDAHQAATADEAAARTVRLAVAAACAEYLELAALQQADEEIALAARQDDFALRGFAPGAAGAWDTRGGYHPQNFNWAHFNWSHTIRGGAHHAHLISGGARGPSVPLPPRPPAPQPDVEVSGTGNLQPAGAPSPGQPAQPAGQPPAGVPGARLEGGDVVQGQQQGPAPMRPGQQPPRRRGRRALRYSPARPRKPARRPQHPGIDGSDSFSSAPDTGGPGGGSAET
jgi:hypothetical protein